MKNNEQWIQHALSLAQYAAERGEVPVGAVIVKDGELIAEGWNQPISSKDPTAHAEVVALRAAAQQLGNYRLTGCDLYVTVEPCSMCVGAMIHARIGRLVYGAPEPRSGAISSAVALAEMSFHNHQMAVTAGVEDEACADLIRSFFHNKRK